MGDSSIVYLMLLFMVVDVKIKILLRSALR